MKAFRNMWHAMQALWLLYMLCYKIASLAQIKATGAHQRIDALVGAVAPAVNLQANGGNIGGPLHLAGTLYGSGGTISVGDSLNSITTAQMSYLASISQAVTAGSDLGSAGSLGSSAAGTVATTSSFPAPQVAYVQALADDYNALRTDVSNLYSFCSTLSARCNGIKDHLQTANLMGP
jgi:hypothetical protein